MCADPRVSPNDEAEMKEIAKNPLDDEDETVALGLEKLCRRSAVIDQQRTIFGADTLLGPGSIAPALVEGLTGPKAEADIYIPWMSAQEAYERTDAEIRKIGNELCANGGHQRMKPIALRVMAFGWSNLETKWKGICGWME